MNMNKKILIGGVGIVVAIVVVLIATGALKLNISVEPSEKAAQQKEFVLPEGWQKYNSGEFGYSVAYPSGWNLTENNNEGSRDVLMAAPEGKALVRISGFMDSSLSSKETVEASIAEYKASFENKPNEMLKGFQSKVEDNMGRFEAAGLMLINDVQYQFLERGLLAINGRVLLLRGAVNTSETELTQEEFDTYVSTVRQVMDSFRTQ